MSTSFSGRVAAALGRRPSRPDRGSDRGPDRGPERGSLDFVSRKLITGWAWPNDDGGHALVDVFVDGVLHATVVADRARPDLAGFGRGDVGFVLPLDLPREERAITVRTRVRGAAADLPNSPFQLQPISMVASVDNPGWYLEQTRSFLKWRFDEAGYFDDIYNGHQPLYGFGVSPCEPGWLERYTITHAIMTELAGLEFESLADIGGAEGYKGALIRDVFGAKVLSADLSPEACALAARIYGLETRAVTMEELPFEDESFDVVLCSESLEHVSQPGRSVDELLRIARLAVVITVPAESLEDVSASIQSGVSHAHINWFHLRSFDHLRGRLHSVQTRAILNTDAAWRGAGRSIEGLVGRFPDDAGFRGMARATIGALVERDRALIEGGAAFNGMVAVLEKRPCQRSEPGPVASVERLLEFAVPPVRRQVGA